MNNLFKNKKIVLMVFLVFVIVFVVFVYVFFIKSSNIEEEDVSVIDDNVTESEYLEEEQILLESNPVDYYESIEDENTKFRIKKPSFWNSEVSNFFSEDLEHENTRMTSSDGEFEVNITYEYLFDEALKDFLSAEMSFNDAQLSINKYNEDYFETVAILDGRNLLVSIDGSAVYDFTEGLISTEPIVGSTCYVYQKYEMNYSWGISNLIDSYILNDTDENWISRGFIISYTFNSQEAIDNWDSYKKVLAEIIGSIEKK